MRRKERGVALVLVLWTVVLLTAIAGALAMTQRTSLQVTTNILLERQQRALLDAGVSFMVLQTLVAQRGGSQSDWKPDGMLRDWQFAGETLGIAATPESARIDLNNAPKDLLDNLLASAGLDEEQVASVRDAIYDWIDPNEAHRLNGAEDPEYEAAGLSYGSRDAKFDSVEELRLVLGMTSQLFDAISPALTVYSQARTVAPAFASRQVLAVLPGMDDEQLQAYLDLRVQQRERGLPVPLPAAADKRFVAASRTPIYRVYAELGIPGGGKLQQAVVVNVGAGRRSPFLILERSFGPLATPERAPLVVEEEN